MRVVLDDINDVPTLSEPGSEGVRIVPLPEFISVEEESSSPLLGTATETLLPVDGMMLMYGDGGAGKTTLTVDAACHLSAGVPWLGIDVPRPVKIALIENEGPRGKFRQMLAEKTATWNGRVPFQANVHVLEEPWTKFSLQIPEHRQALSVHVSQTETDLVVMGPLATLGMVGGGTPDEISAFEALLRETRALITRAFAFWIVHHENKAGDVSGAWERVPDTLCHVQAQGNGHTRLVWRKARWSSENHGKSLDLVWAEGRSYEIRDPEDIDYHAEIIAAFEESDDWRTVKETRELLGRKEKPVKDALSDLVDRGELEFQKGPPGRVAQARCYRLRSAPNARAQSGAVLPLGGVDERSAPLRPPYREKGGSRRSSQTPRSAPSDVGAVLSDEEELPF